MSIQNAILSGALRAGLVASIALAPTLGGAKEADPQGVSPAALYIIGQDLGAIRGYLESDCCAPPDGGTAYLGFYSLLDPDANFGGLGVDAQLRPVASERGWGSGPVSAWKTAQETPGGVLVLGLSLTDAPEGSSFADVAHGRFDAEIDQLGRFIIASEKRVLLRIGYEFDGSWNAAYADHSTFKDVWRHIVDRLRAADVTNVEYVWHGSASPIDDIIESRHEDIVNWYPGDSYVDWVGTSWFLLADAVPIEGAGEGFTPLTHRELTDELVDFAREHGKPVIVAELSPQGFDLTHGTRRAIGPIWDGPSGELLSQKSAAGIWQAWYHPFLSYLDANSDVIRAVAYINANWDAQPMWGPPYQSGYWGDSRLQYNEDIAAAWSRAIEQWRSRP